MICILLSQICRIMKIFKTKPACHTKDPSIFGIEFLACDFEIILDVIMESLKNNELQHHDQCDKLFKKSS